MTATVAANTDQDQIDALINASDAPIGVVFEIVSGDRDKLAEALPRTRKFIHALRKRFPDIKLAVISHGNEQFALVSENQVTSKVAHELARSFKLDEGVTVEICGSHATMRGVAKDSFPDYVHVASGASAAIGGYLEQGYTLIAID